MKPGEIAGGIDWDATDSLNTTFDERLVRMGEKVRQGGETLLSTIRDSPYLRKAFALTAGGALLWTSVQLSGIDQESRSDNTPQTTEQVVSKDQPEDNGDSYTAVRNELQELRAERARLQAAKRMEKPAISTDGIWGMVENSLEKIGYEPSDEQVVNIVEDVTEDVDALRTHSRFEKANPYRQGGSWDDCTIPDNPNCISEHSPDGVSEAVKNSVHEYQQDQVDKEYADAFEAALDAGFSGAGVQMVLQCKYQRPSSTEDHSYMQPVATRDSDADAANEQQNDETSRSGDDTTSSHDNKAYQTLRQVYKNVQEKADTSQESKVRRNVLEPAEEYLNTLHATDENPATLNDVRGMLHNGDAETIAEAALDSAEEASPLEATVENAKDDTTESAAEQRKKENIREDQGEKTEYEQE